MAVAYRYRYGGLGTVAVILLVGVCVLMVAGSAWAQQQTPGDTPAGPAAIAQPASAPNPNAVAPNNDASAVTPSAAPAARPALPPADLRLDSGDLLEIKVFGVPDLSQETRVSGSGSIDLQLVGAVPVKGLTTAEAEKMIEYKLKHGGFLNDPHVSVFAKEYSSQGISVLGEVAKPGVYVLPGSRRLYDVISTAGGLTQRAGREVTIAHRDAPDHPEKLEISTDPTRSPASNVQIRPGDTVVISRAGVVYVVGDVTKPAGFVMDDDGGMTVMQAVVLAGGPTSTASLNKARVIRRGPNGSLTEIPMPLKQILSAKRDDVKLQANDILFVPSSSAKRALYKGSGTIVQAAGALAIYRP